jgi:hypothetical protein
MKDQFGDGIIIHVKEGLCSSLFLFMVLNGMDTNLVRMFIFTRCNNLAEILKRFFARISTLILCNFDKILIPRRKLWLIESNGMYDNMLSRRMVSPAKSR